MEIQKSGWHCLIDSNKQPPNTKQDLLCRLNESYFSFKNYPDMW